MTKRIRKTDASAVNVADYIVERLAAEGIDHCFGVAGDYVFPMCDAIDSSAKVKWIGCANELPSAKSGSLPMALRDIMHRDANPAVYGA